MNHIGLFEGIGGFSLAAQWMGWKTIAWCEINPFCQRVLKYYFKDANQHEDIKTTDFTVYRGICDILTGGFPCQPYSAAGKRKGKEDDRHLWPQMRRAVREIQPGFVVAENVLGIVNWSGGLVFNEVQADLEAEGYEVFTYVLPACAVNAPHRRDRVWFVAYSHSNRNRNIERQNREKNGVQGIGREAVHAREFAGTASGAIADTKRNGNVLNGGEWGNLYNSNRFYKEKELKRDDFTDELGGDNKRSTSNPCNKGLQGCKVNGSIGSIGSERNEQFAGFLQPNWGKFPTEPALRGRNDGISTELSGITVPSKKGGFRTLTAKQSYGYHRNESIRAYGNAIVPQVAFEVFKAIQSFENLNN